jgi:hypothetical protein
MLGCVSEPTFDVIPYIGFNSARIITKTSSDLLGNTTKRDSLILTINFQDGDGDLGLTQDDYKKLILIQPNLRTFDVDLYVKKKGTYIKSTPSFPLGGNHFQRYKEGDKPGPIEGSIDFSINFDYNNFSGIPSLTGKKIPSVLIFGLLTVPFTKVMWYSLTILYYLVINVALCNRLYAIGAMS